MNRLAWTGGVALGVVLFLTVPSARAVIMRLMPLREVLNETDHICMLKVERLDPDRPAVILTVEEDLKGKAPFRRLPMNLTGDSEGQKLNHTPQLLKRLAPDLPVALFATKRGKRYTGFFYTNGTWFQALGVESDDAVRWSFTHCEPYLRRTFKGTTAELRQVIVDSLAKKSKPPEPDPKEPPGLGPEVKPPGEPKKTGQAHLSTGPVFAVIPTTVAAPLALLALLFPAVFGGMFVTMKRWFIGLSVVSLNSTLFFLQQWFQGSIREYWWGSPLVLWVVMTVLALLGTLAAWRRHRRAIQSGSAPAKYGLVERLVFLAMTLTGIFMVGYALYHKEPLLGPSQRSILVIWVGIWTGTGMMLLHGLRGASDNPPRLSAETGLLTAMLAGYVGIGAATWPQGPAATGDVRIVWEFRPKEKGQFLSSPLVAESRVYIAAAHNRGFDTFGIVYCLDRETGHEIWSFDNDLELKQIYSTPTLAGDSLYIGEGLHQDNSCKLFCLDARTGKKRWEFATKSHVESSPVVVNDRVFFGAGDDGLYALDAETGELLWQFNEERHIDAGALVTHNRVFVGTGVSRTYRTTEILCLNAETGKPVWRMPVDLPAWGTPALLGGRSVVIGLGNGNLLERDAKQPAGAVLCLEAETGKRFWRRDLPDSVLGQPCILDDNVLCGSRDGHLYCFDPKDGRPRWQMDLGNPVVGSPVGIRWAVKVPTKDEKVKSSIRVGWNVCTASTKGLVASASLEDGELRWKLDLAKHMQAETRVLGSPAVGLAADLPRRHQVFVAAGVGSEIAMFPVLYCLDVSDEAASKPSSQDR